MKKGGVLTPCQLDARRDEKNKPLPLIRPSLSSIDRTMVVGSEPRRTSGES